MSISTLADLKASAEAILHRNIDQYFPTLIPMTESRLNRELQCAELETKVVITTNTSQITLPDDYNKLIGIQVGDRVPILVTSQYVQDSYRYTHDLLYSIHGNTLELRPTITSNVDVELSYFKKLLPLVDDTDTNEVLVAYPSVYLYSILVDYSMISYDDRQNEWGTLLTKELESIYAHYIDSKHSGSPLRIRSTA